MSEAYDHHFQDTEEFSEMSKSRKTGDGWVMSFADVVTVLLCFFIIFYMIEKQLDKTAIGFGVSSGTVQEYKTKMSTPEVLALIETIKQMPNLAMVNTDQFLEVHFPPEMFFKSGSTRITSAGQKAIDSIVKPLMAINDGYILQVQGYTDDTLVKWKAGRNYQDNMQLSLQRALKVYYHLLKKGVGKNILTVSGFGANKPLVGEIRKNQRRISLKFEPILHDGK